ncbi:AbrB family transcriptional regulator [Pseudorhizobium endolithicum]|uniref:AbrB family transcriptional regulator n=1 Tax=Pseudorhizobium endolithicum TaxID=1191678 RepID=A0ABM8PW37_9HYPH|nr:AbrB/MazE/SpoVT family DNA-binding domain-containing protein [Pseudorhizobium endolithicum]CAD7051553.1 AbrB family transcriptional regulator [Pseudorhizobium endolithicum]
MAGTLTTTISTKGQVILPKVVRDRRDCNAGTKLIVEETPEGVLLKRAPIFPPTRPSDVFGMLRDKYSGKPKTIEEMDAGLLEAVAADFKRSVDPDS